MKKTVFITTLIFTLLFVSGITVNASYNYAPWGDAIESANSMSAVRVIDNSNLLDAEGNKSTFVLGDLKDVFAYEDLIYVTDATNNKIFVLNNQYQLVDYFPKEVEVTTEAGTEWLVPETHRLNKPNGIYIKDNQLYVADTENGRIAVFDLDTKELLMEVKNPQDPIFETTSFKPLKVSVERTGRIFVIAFDIYEGIMDFNPDGSFSRFYGTNTITMSLFESLVYRLSSQEQRARQSLKLQASFVNIDIDPYGYVYAVSRPDVVSVVKKFNFKGQDILNKNGYVPPIGDTHIEEYNSAVPNGKSNIVDVAVSGDGNFYSILDSKRGRVFSYDNEGNLLYIFGGIGSQSSMFTQPTSLTYFNDQIIVTDNMNKSIIVFQPTVFGDLINDATKLYLESKYIDAKEIWNEVLELNSNYFLAYTGIGKAQLREGNYKDAMTNLKLGYDHYNYSKAYEQYRNEKLDQVLPTILVISFLGIVYMFYRSFKSSIEREKEGGE
jgi:tetratricopeptide (TPR) repeat protein